MKVLLLGAEGQVGRELRETIPAGMTVTAAGHNLLDITDLPALQQALKEIQPNAIINAAAYTAVDKAESERQQAFAVNAEGPANLALLAEEYDIDLIHISTDFVFDGRQGSPYRPESPTNPVSVYGASKREGERQILEIRGSKALIVRTSWVYSSYGNNFVKTMLRLMREKTTLNVVSDQIGSPTWAKGLASALWKMVELRLTGIHHWSDAGVASWYDFAQAIQEESLSRGLLQRSIVIQPIPTALYPTPASRPPYSVLDKTATWQALGYSANHWRTSLCNMLQRIGKHG
ncbi:dTDP-4-dehydrorhamnose reductase [Candidatus Magnetaquicoccus inordinatus]|uniref:dTDP-4-dehydrorhamnose reductase n=1 Tax=Candidatus Magnetaquicoccus inordinatus TaxID=2496818 RepID=UPI00102ACBD1|nr:dTDP-4-dehydrorhamnose reductase [Candidatus Magnetaquicoccus inordinatus]